MQTKFPTKRTLAALVCAALPCWAAAQPSTAAAALQPVAAASSPIATRSPMLGLARAGKRLVAVGDHGIVLLSDDQGRTFRQAAAVPVSSLLTAVAFVNEREGWAVGHWGAILATNDGGNTWRQQRLDVQSDRPLFAVHFFDARHGVAVGLWSLVLRTDDGGQSWVEQPVDPIPGSTKADLNLLSLFADRQGNLYATAERGFVLRSADQGRSWRYLATGYKGSLWAGAVLADGQLLVGGQRGTLMLGHADGSAWRQLPPAGRTSVTAIATEGDQVLVAGLDGLLQRSRDGGQSFTPVAGAATASFTGALPVDGGRWALVSRGGPVVPLTAQSTP